MAETVAENDIPYGPWRDLPTKFHVNPVAMQNLQTMHDLISVPEGRECIGAVIREQEGYRIYPYGLGTRGRVFLKAHDLEHRRFPTDTPFFVANLSRIKPDNELYYRGSQLFLLTSEQLTDEKLVLAIRLHQGTPLDGRLLLGLAHPHLQSDSTASLPDLLVTILPFSPRLIVNFIVAEKDATALVRTTDTVWPQWHREMLEESNRNRFDVIKSRAELAGNTNSYNCAILQLAYEHHIGVYQGPLNGDGRLFRQYPEMVV